jgi:DNA transposition AAA+ family ATPase
MECEVSRQIGSAIEAIRRTNDIGLILGDAGVGKTCALALYCEENPTCIMITIPEWAHDMRSVEGRIFAAIAHGDWDGRTKRGDYLAIRLKGSNRLIVVDNAHKLTRPALRGCSISMTPPGAPSPSSETRMSWTKSSITTSGSRASDSKSKSSSSGQPP